MKHFLTLLTVIVTTLSGMAVDTSDFVIDEGPTLDVNCDGAVTASDVTAIYNYILNGVTTYYSTSDVNGDGSVTASDITAIYNYILSGTSPSGGSVITMQDFIPSNLSSYSSDDYNHQWAEGDVIFIAVDPDYTGGTVCQNVYAMVRTGGKWVLQDVQGSNKQGFKTSGGTICAVYVQHADLSKSYYNYIPLNGDVACVNRAANYTVTPKNGKFYIKINDIILYHFVSRIDVSGAYEGDYFYESVTRLDALTRIMWQPFYSYSDFHTSTDAPVIDIDNSTHKGYAYGVWRKDTYANGWLTLNYAKNNGYAYRWPYNQTGLEQGRSLSIYSPWVNTWNRDLSMRYYNSDDKTSYRLNAGSTYQNVNINVGTNIIFRPWDGNVTDTRGTMTSVTSSNSGILDITYDNTQVSVTAHKVGTVTLTIKFKTKDNVNCTYTYEVTVKPTVWAAGKSSDNKPKIWRNWEDRTSYISSASGYGSYKSANRIIVHGNTAHVLLRNDVSNSNTAYTLGYAAIYRCTSAQGGDYYNQYKSGLSGVSKHYGSNGNVKHYIHGIPQMWVDKNNNVYFTSAYREQNTTELDGYISTDVYKNNTLLKSIPSIIISDLATDNSGHLMIAGYAGNYQSRNGNYYSLGNETGELGIFDDNNNISYTLWDHYLFNQLHVKNGMVYVDAIGYYKKYDEYAVSFYRNVYLRCTSSSALALYTGQVSEGGLSMGGSFSSTGGNIHHHPFCFDGDKFYTSGYMAPIRTYQLGASETVTYTAYPSNTSPLYFDVKNGIIGMVLNNGSSSARKVMASELNSYNDGTDMENSTGATIYDVWLQTSLDD